MELASRSVGMALFAVAFGAPLADASLSPAQRCSGDKAKATARAYVCVVRERSAELLGAEPADFAGCSLKIARSFERSEERGGCLLTGDSPAAEALVLDAEEDVSAAFGIGSAVTQEQRDCVAMEIRIVARFASCRARAWAKFLGGALPPIERLSVDRCLDKLGSQLSRAYYDLGCGLPAGAAQVHPEVGAVAAYLAGAELTGRDFYSAGLVGATLTYAQLAGATMERTNLDLADLTGANLSDATLASAFLPGAVAAGADFSAARIADTDWTGGILDGANFTDASLAGTNLTDASLVSADLGNANLENTILTGADIDSALFDAVTWDNTTCPDGTNSDANGMTCCGHHAGNPPATCSP